MSQDSQQTNTNIQFFFPGWVTEILYCGEWWQVKTGTYREGINTDRGSMNCYEDPLTGEQVFLLENVTGYKVKKPEPVEPQATITELHPKR